ncbi:NTF2-like protein [Glarea lozoyensis ATCC 20868]|uniref:NTF2-like protein n=1 Tax=Glarea lozoyensis (strain ATCC 20868 / MF5171) TaxID=1116229 RepID=S3CT34_GLAL2|nr:NTF2-like protein [Glarea lozoyensis ATCC 20868]EPE28785.1 NTF2-like protein [Glarea lozoyensis ATCC 20868]
MATPLPSPSALRLQYASYLEFCNAHAFSSMESFYTSPIKINDVPLAPADVTAQFRPLVAAFPDWHWEIRHFAIEGEYLHLHFKVGGTHLGIFEGIAPTGRRVETSQFTLYHVVQGRYAEVWDVTDFEGVREQIRVGMEGSE